MLMSETREGPAYFCTQPTCLTGTTVMCSGVWLQKAQDEVGPECTVAYFSMFSDEAKCWSNASTYGIYGKCPPHSFTGQYHIYYIFISYSNTIHSRLCQDEYCSSPCRLSGVLISCSVRVSVPRESKRCQEIIPIFCQACSHHSNFEEGLGGIHQEAFV